MCVRNLCNLSRFGLCNFYFYGTVHYYCIMIAMHIIQSIQELDSEDRFGAWSTEGCKEVMREGNRRVCEFTQLAHFGILFVS